MTVSNAPSAPVRNPPKSLANPAANKFSPQQAPQAKPINKSWLKSGASPFWTGLGLSGAWTAGVLAAILQSGPAHNFAGIPLTNWALGVSAIVSPVALVWMVVAYLQRATDIHSVADPLRRQLSLITGESGAAEARIRRFNQAIREQIDLLKNAQSMSKGDFAVIMENIRGHREELEQFEQGSIEQVKEIQEIVRRSMQQIENQMDAKFTMLRILDERLVQSGDTVARQTEAVREHLSTLLDEVEGRTGSMADSLERAMRDSKKLADTSLAQQSSLTEAAESAAETLNGLSGKIDLSVARFLERAGTAREEAERLASALDAQTRSLDEFSNTLPVRVSEAESVMRGVADRLYASEQLAREQAVHLTEKLSWQVDGLQGFLDRFSTRLSEVDTNLLQRRNDLDLLATRIDGATTTFTSSWEVSMNGLTERANDTIVKFKAINEETRHGAEQVSSHLSETTARYESSAIRLNHLTGESSERMKAMTQEIATHLTQFEALREASDKAGAEVQERATSAIGNLQHILERLLNTREATTSVGENLVRDLHAAVDQNEHLIIRLNEAAQMSVRALGIASESLGKQETESAERTRSASAMLQEAAVQMQQQAQVAERGLRDQAVGLMALLNETRTQMVAAEQNLQGFAARAMPTIQETIRQVDTSTTTGLQSLTSYGDGLNERITQLQQFHARVGSMSDDMKRTAEASASSIEQLAARFTSVKTVQEQTARETLEQFADLSDRLQREVAGLDSQTAKAVETLQQAAARVGEQSYQLLQTTEASGAKMQMITSTVQNEATQIRTVLQKQADDLATDLSRAEKQFSNLGDALKQRTDAAYAVLDRVAQHYNETTRTTTQDFETRTQKLEQVTGQAQGKVDALIAGLTQQLTLITNGTNQLEAQTTQIGNVSGKALQQLTGLNEKIAFTHEVANNNTRQTLSRLDECNAAFARQGNAVSEVAQTSIAQLQKAGAVLGEQIGKLQDSGQKIDQNIRQLGVTTASVHEQSTQIRNTMEQQHQRLTVQLSESVNKLTSAGTKLEQTTATALLGADQAATRFGDMTQTASTRLTTCATEMEQISSKAESALSSLGANVTQQAASLSVIADQLHEQNKEITAANDSQRTQLLDLFDKLGSAHAQASEVAEKTITRLGESIGQIQHQLGLMSDQSQSALGNVRTASGGFSEQATALVQSAQAAEQQARTVLSVTASLQDQARQMQDQIQNDSRRATDALGNLVGKLTSGGGELRDFASQTEASLVSLNNNVQQQGRDLSGAVVQLSERQRSLTTALDAQRDVLNGLVHRLTLAQDETAAAAERSAGRLTEGSNQIARQIEAMGTQAKETLANVQAVNSAFASEAGVLSLHAQQAEQQMRGVLTVTAGLQDQARQARETMQEESARVIEHMNAALTQIDNTTQMLKTQGNSVAHVMDQSVLQFATHARKSSDELMKNVDTLTDAADRAESRLSSAGDQVRNHLKVVTEIGDQTEVQARQLADSAEYATSRLVTLRDSLINADTESQNIAAAASARILEAKTALQGELMALAELSHETVRNVGAASSSLTDQNETLRNNLAMSESALQEAARQVREENAQLPAVLERSALKIEGAVKALKDQADNADHLLVGTADRFISVTSTARDSMADEMRRISTTAEQANHLLGDFVRALADQMEAFKSSTNVLTQEQASFVTAASANVSQLASASDRLAHLRSDAAQTAERLAREFDTIDQRATSTHQRLAETSGAMVASVEALAQASGRAEAQMTGASGQFREQLERIRTGLQGQIDDINRGLMQITAQLERTGTSLRSTTAGTVADVERIAQRFDQTSKEASTQLTEKTSRMRASTEEAAQLLSGFGDQMDVLLDRLSTAGDGIRRHEGDLGRQLQTALDQLGGVTEKLELGRTLAISVSDQTVAKLGTVVAEIQKEMQSLTTGSQTAAGIMRGIGQIYGDQTQALNQGVRDAHGQVQQMTRAVDDMQQRADRMRVSLKLQGDELMMSLQQILSQLSSTGDSLTDSVDHVLKSRAEEALKKIG
jgi:hypothetical protein